MEDRHAKSKNCTLKIDNHDWKYDLRVWEPASTFIKIENHDWKTELRARDGTIWKLKRFPKTATHCFVVGKGWDLEGSGLGIMEYNSWNITYNQRIARKGSKFMIENPICLLWKTRYESLIQCSNPQSAASYIERMRLRNLRIWMNKELWRETERLKTMTGKPICVLRNRVQCSHYPIPRSQIFFFYAKISRIDVQNPDLRARDGTR